MKISIVAPCYNEEENVKLFYNEIVKNFKNENLKCEIIFIDDGSRDNTVKEIEKIVKESKKMIIKEISFSRNFGKEAAIYAGLKQATGDYVCIIDTDLQQDPKYILKMLDYLEKNPEYDEVATYQKKRKEPLLLSFFKKSFYLIINAITDIDFVNGASDFRLFRKKVADSILEICEYHRFSKGIFSFVGYNVYYMPYTVEKRKHGKTSWNFMKLFKYALSGIVSYTTLPLRIPYLIALLFFISSIIYLIILIVTNAFVIGNTILLIFLFSMSMLFLTLGIIGGYLAKVYIQGKNRPVYIVKKYCSNEKSDNNEK